MNESSLQRIRIIRGLIGLRWVNVLALVSLFAFMTRSFDVLDAIWYPMGSVLGGYALINIICLAIVGYRRDRVGAPAVEFVAAIGLIADFSAASYFGWSTLPMLGGLTVIPYIFTIISSGMLYAEIAVFFVAALTFASYGAIAQYTVAGEVLIERIGGLTPQLVFLCIAAAFAVVMRKFNVQGSADLTHSRKLLETVVENLVDGIVIVDTDMRILFINRSGAEILGVKIPEVLGLKARQHLALPVKNVTNLLKVIHGVSPDVTQADVQLEHPEERLLHVQKSPVWDPSGTLVGQMYVVRDMTRDMLLNKIKSDFISVAAHQLRTPLSSVKWAFSVLDEGSLGALTEDQQPVVRQGLETTDRLVRLVNSLLNVSRIEEGRFGFEFASVDMGGLIGKVITTLTPKAAERGVRVDYAQPNGTLPGIEADAEKIELVLENFIDNAVSYTPSGGSVRIETVKEGKFVRTSITDTGVGIPQAQQALLFTKFFRGDNVVRLQTEGSGLGLYIAKNIVERHGGVISVTSRESEGTTVSFTLPIA